MERGFWPVGNLGTIRCIRTVWHFRILRVDGLERAARVGTERTEWVLRVVGMERMVRRIRTQRWNRRERILWLVRVERPPRRLRRERILRMERMVRVERA